MKPCSLVHFDVSQVTYFSIMAFFQFIMTAVSVALPIPAGVFFPVFLIGKKILFYTVVNYALFCLCGRFHFSSYYKLRYVLC